MVRGLDVFREHFAGHADQFVLIGGTAATLAMEEAGLEFRATKDLDIVLHIEALSLSFGEVFWRFVEAGGYEIRQASDTGKPVFYRFQKPADDRFPVMLELFCRAPEAGAWLDLGERQAKGEPIDTKNIRRHANDMLHPSQLLAPDTRIPVAERIAQDMNRFLDAIDTDRSIYPKSLKINSSVGEIAERIALLAYGSSRPRET